MIKLTTSKLKVLESEIDMPGGQEVYISVMPSIKSNGNLLVSFIQLLKDPADKNPNEPAKPLTPVDVLDLGVNVMEIK
jgi:hypothetical protein